MYIITPLFYLLVDLAKLNFSAPRCLNFPSTFYNIAIPLPDIFKLSERATFAMKDAMTVRDTEN